MANAARGRWLSRIARWANAVVVVCLALAAHAADIDVQAVDADLGEITPGASVRLTLRVSNTGPQPVEVVPVVTLPSSWSLLVPAVGVTVQPDGVRVISVLATSSATTPGGAFFIDVALVANGAPRSTTRFAGTVRTRRDVRWVIREQPPGLVVDGSYRIEATLVNDGNESFDVSVRALSDADAIVEVRPALTSLVAGARVDVSVDVRVPELAGYFRQRLRLEAATLEGDEVLAAADFATEFAASVAFGDDRERRFRLVVDTSLQVPNIAAGITGRAFGVSVTGGGPLNDDGTRSVFGSVRFTGAPSLVGNVTYRDGPLSVQANADPRSGFGVRVRYDAPAGPLDGFLEGTRAGRGARLGASYAFSVDEATAGRVDLASDLTIGGTSLGGSIGTVFGQQVTTTPEGATVRRGGVAFGTSASVSGGGGFSADASASADLGAVGVGAFAGTSTSIFGNVLRGGASASLGLADAIGLPLAFAARVSAGQQSTAGLGVFSTSLAWAGGATLSLGPIAAAASIGQRTDDRLVDETTEVTRDLSVSVEALFQPVRVGAEYQLTRETQSIGSSRSLSEFGIRWAFSVAESDWNGRIDLVRERSVEEGGGEAFERTFSGVFVVQSPIAGGTIAPRLAFTTTLAEPGFDEIEGQLAAEFGVGDFGRFEPAVSFNRSPGVTRFGAQASWSDRLSDTVRTSVFGRASVGGGPPTYALSNQVSVELENDEVLRGSLSVSAGAGQRAIGFGIGYLVPVGFAAGEFGGVGRVVGRIVDEFRQGVPGVVLELNGWAVASDADGQFRFEDVPAGTYRLRLRDAPARDVAYRPALPIEVEVVEDAVQTILIERSAAASLVGLVELREMPPTRGVIYGSGSPARDRLAAANLVIELRDGERSVRAAVGADGRFEFVGLSAGTYELVVDASALDAVLYRAEPLRQVVVLQPGGRANVLLDLVPLPRSVEIQNGQ